MTVNASTFATNIFYLDGVPLKLPYESTRHLYPIYNKPSNAILLKFARQTHKSTTVAFKTVLPCLKYPNFHSLYVAPTGNQVSVFSTDKLDGAIRGSSVIKENFLTTQTKDQITYKELANGSKIYLRSAFHTADAVRGISSDQTSIDEVQDIVSDHIPVIEQSMGHSLAKYDHMKDRIPGLPMHFFNSKIYAGTPKSIDNTMEKYWLKSSMCEFLIHCTNQGCGKWNYIDECNIGEVQLICRKCGKPIFYENGQWVSMNQGGFISGYRLPSIVLPWINNIKNPEAWKINVIQPRSIYSAEKYANEVLALSYAAARHPLSAPELQACCEDYDMITEDTYDMNPLLKGVNVIVAGIDWGKGELSITGSSFSILCITALIRGKYKVIFMKRYSGKLSDPILQIEDMLRIIFKFQCKLVIADTGDGRTSNAMMVEALGPTRFAEAYEHGTIRQKIRWEREKGIYVFNRSRVMVDAIMSIKRTEIGFFKYDQFKEFQSDFTGIYSEYSDSTRMTKFDHVTADDCFHGFLFSTVALNILTGKYNRYLFGGVNED
jgi:hypothetical protein